MKAQSNWAQVITSSDEIFSSFRRTGSFESVHLALLAPKWLFLFHLCNLKSETHLERGGKKKRELKRVREEGELKRESEKGGKSEWQKGSLFLPHFLWLCLFLFSLFFPLFYFSRSFIFFFFSLALSTFSFFLSIALFFSLLAWWSASNSAHWWKPAPRLIHDRNITNYKDKALNTLVASLCSKEKMPESFICIAHRIR